MYTSIYIYIHMYIYVCVYIYTHAITYTYMYTFRPLDAYAFMFDVIRCGLHRLLALGSLILVGILYSMLSGVGYIGSLYLRCSGIVHTSR